MPQIADAQKINTTDFKHHFDRYDVEGCFILYDQKADQLIQYNPDLCEKGYIPASTFKIPHSLIALEEKVIKDEHQVIPWDGTERSFDLWNRDQTLETAVKNSCVWVYEGFASEIGINKYYSYVEAFDYGNKDLAGPPTRFWLAGSFRISAIEQIDFLEKLYNYKLPVSDRSVDIVKSTILLEHTNTYQLFGKTGGGMISDHDYIMWMVGFIEKNDQPYFYTLNFISDDFEKTGKARLEITKAILKDLNLIE